MKEKIKKLKQSDLMPKILSLVIAILLWFYVMNVVDPLTKRSFKNVPVRIEGLQDLRRRGGPTWTGSTLPTSRPTSTWKA